MDCDKFDSVILDLLYDELDELTQASAARHADQCARCRKSLAGFKATREIGILPLTEPPDGFESRVLEAERKVRRHLPLRTRLIRTLTIVSGYAMRPQLAMAALLMLMIGISLVWLRPKPGTHASMQVTEHGAPETEKELVVAIPEKKPPHPEPVAAAEQAIAKTDAPAEAEVDKARRTAGDAPRPAAAPGVSAVAESAQDAEEEDRARAEAEDRAYATAMDAYRAGSHDEAQRQFDAIVASGGRNARAAELYAAYATEKLSGCAAALPRFDSVSASNANNDLGHQATWQSATCRMQLGLTARARLDLERLAEVPAYQSRARQALQKLGDDSSSSLLATRRRSAPKSEAKAEEAPTAAAPAPPSVKAKASRPNAGAGAESKSAKASRRSKKSQAKKPNPRPAAPPTTNKKSAPTDRNSDKR